MRDRTQFTGLDEFEGSCALGWSVVERLNPHASKNEAMRHTAAQIQPIAENELMRFSAFVTYGYNWDDSSSWGDTAHSDGYLGVFITSFQLDGSGGRVEVDQRSHMWSDGTGWWEEHSDSGEGLIWPNSQVEVFLPVTSSRIFLFWIWALQSGDAGSDSSEIANLDGVVPFMVFEQFT